MSRSAIKWGQLERYLQRHGYQIKGSGGEKIVVAPKDGKQRSRNTICIGHTSCSSQGSQVLACYISKLKNVFNISIEDILNE